MVNLSICFFILHRSISILSTYLL